MLRAKAIEKTETLWQVWDTEEHYYYLLATYAPEDVRAYAMQLAVYDGAQLGECGVAGRA